MRIAEVFVVSQFRPVVEHILAMMAQWRSTDIALVAHYIKTCLLIVGFLSLATRMVLLDRLLLGLIP
jgi:hypothetical protein